ncbi:MAG: hypothetical protein U0527_13465 [Candidatus Eisenbacteria bacterium]
MLDLLLAAAREKEGARVALLSAARLGRPEVAERLVAAAAEPRSRVAGFALARLFGLDLAAEGLVKRDAESAPAKNEAIDRSYLDDGFAEPDAERVRARWTERGRRARPEHGSRRRAAHLDCAPRRAGRRAAARTEAALLECRLRLPDLPLLESRAWADDQRRARETLRASGRERRALRAARSLAGPGRRETMNDAPGGARRGTMASS